MMTEELILKQISYHQTLAEHAAYACLCNRRCGDSKTAAGNYNDFIAHYTFVAAFEEVLR